MGGINCPSPKIAKCSPSIYANYVQRLANYSRDLFNGSANFFAANAAVEEAVLGDKNLQNAIQLLSDSENALLSARDELGSVAALLDVVGETRTDFGEQQKLITSAMVGVSTVRLDLQMLSNTEPLQQALWNDSAITNNFVIALNSLNDAMRWQATFAKSSELATV